MKIEGERTVQKEVGYKKGKRKNTLNHQNVDDDDFVTSILLEMNREYTCKSEQIDSSGLLNTGVRQWSGDRNPVSRFDLLYD